MNGLHIAAGGPSKARSSGSRSAGISSTALSVDKDNQSFFSHDISCLQVALAKLAATAAEAKASQLDQALAEAESSTR